MHARAHTHTHCKKCCIVIIIIIIIIIAPLTIVSEDQWGDLECLLKPANQRHWSTWTRWNKRQSEMWLWWKIVLQYMLIAIIRLILNTIIQYLMFGTYLNADQPIGQSTEPQCQCFPTSISFAVSRWSRSQDCARWERVIRGRETALLNTNTSAGRRTPVSDVIHRGPNSPWKRREVLSGTDGHCTVSLSNLQFLSAKHLIGNMFYIRWFKFEQIIRINILLNQITRHLNDEV